MQNNMRDRLIELLQSVPAEHDGCRGVGRIADHLIANGVIVPPCKVGTDVYNLCNGNVQQMTVERLMYAESQDTHENSAKAYAYCKEEYECCELLCDRKNKDCMIGISCGDVGKTVFLTREEAEQEVRERESNE